MLHINNKGLKIQKTSDNSGTTVHSIDLKGVIIDVEKIIEPTQLFDKIKRLKDCENKQVLLSYLNNDIEHGDEVDFYFYNNNNRVDYTIQATDMFDFI